MKANIVIRNARDLLQVPYTVDHLVKIFKLLDRDIYTVSETMTRIEAEMGRTHVAVLCDERAGYIVGAMVLRESLPWRRSLEIEKVAVAKEHQRQGIGRALLGHAIAMGMRDSYECLEVVTHKGYQAVGFYEKCDFVPVYTDTRCVGMKYDLLSIKRNNMT